MDLACTTGALATTRPFALGGWEFGNFDTGIAEAVISYNVTQIDGKVVDGCDHAEMTKCEIAGVEYHPGDKAPVSCKAYDKFNHRLRSMAFGPILIEVVAREAAVSGDTKLLENTLQGNSKKGARLALTSASLHGLLGETALHSAAASGHVKAMSLLIAQQANPNQQDNDGETPLHYAALSGRMDAVKFLLRHSAQTEIESYFMETASVVAKDNVAFFLGIETAGVLRLLEVAEAHSEYNDDMSRGSNHNDFSTGCKEGCSL